tara:strand:+ start:335 stop:493 length:159 start_codon:yes stop_codon:yes gene_type:complete
MLVYLFFSVRKRCDIGKDPVISYQLELIADPYSDHKFLKENDSTAKKEMPKM